LHSSNHIRALQHLCNDRDFQSRPIFNQNSGRRVAAACNFGVKVRKTWFGPRDKDARRRAQEIGAGEGPPFIAE
jgi:hypothetical protein